MHNTPVNPWQWSVELGFNQAELVEEHTCTLYLSGQTAVDAQGQPQHKNNMAAQITLALDNLEEVLASAGMTLTNLVRLNIYTTDMDQLITHHGLITGRMSEAEVKPPGTLLGVTRLAYPELMVELEGTAVA